MADTLAQAVRAKYPGVYDDLSDTDLEAKVKAKYPGVYDDLPTTPATTPKAAATDQRSTFDRVVDSVVGAPGAGEVLKGMGKSVLGTIEGGGKLIRSIPVIGPALAAGPEVTLPVSTKPSNSAQALGKAAGNVGQFLAPGGALTEAKAAIKTGSAVLDALVGAGLEGTSAGSVEAAQSGDLNSGLKAGAAAAATAGVMSAAQPVAKALGERIEKVLLKPKERDVNDGFKIENVYKYGLGGTVQDTIDKSGKLLNNLSTSLKNVLTANPSASVDVTDALGAAKARMVTEAEAGKSGLSYEEINKATDKLLDKLIPPTQGAGGNSAVDLLTANQVKQTIGDIGAWLHKPNGVVVVNDESNALEQAANTFYDELKTRIEGAASPGAVKQLNRAMGDIIAVRRAAIRRIASVSNSNLIKTGDMVGLLKGGPTGWGIALADRLLRSGNIANLLASSAQSAAAPAVAARATGAAVGASQ